MTREDDSGTGPIRLLALEFATNWAIVVHACYVLALVCGLDAFAHRWMFPLSHLYAWGIFIGAHVLVFHYPETMHRSQVRGQERLGPFTILVGHEVKHGLPLVLLYVVDAAWPAPGRMTALSIVVMTTLGVAAAGLYFAVHRSDNPYRVDARHFRAMLQNGLIVGALANLLVLWVSGR